MLPKYKDLVNLIIINEKFLLNFGAEFVVSFSSGSRSLALKSSSKSHQMTTFLFKKGVWVELSSFEVKLYHFEQVVIWWLFNDDLRARGQEPDTKRIRKSGPYSLIRLMNECAQSPPFPRRMTRKTDFVPIFPTPTLSMSFLMLKFVQFTEI